MVPFHDMSHDEFARTFPKWCYTYASGQVLGIANTPSMDPRDVKGLNEYHMYWDGTKDVNDPKEPKSKFE